ncbi:MAG TPA: peptide chain release factor N(5)-glutamine methyltransferase [Bacteroidales bacterium]|nr:peptide chain release factor N(5)-glutamine methyltransferase [Bacteroidales bacterium]
MSINLLTINDIRSYLDKELSSLYSPEEIKILTRIIFKTLFGSSWLHLINNSKSHIDNSKISEIMNFCQELKTGKPYQYVFGETEFYNCRIKVNESVLIPRPETEELVDIIIKQNKNFRGKIIDFGTGSGCIAIALALNMPDSEVIGVDISEEALRLAELNAQLNKAKVKLILDDILNTSISNNNTAGIFVSNPPYVMNREKTLMKRNVLDFEPHSALFVDDSDPLLFYREILNISRSLLEPGGKIYFEINEALGTEVAALLESYYFNDINIKQDLNNRDRIATGIKP